MMFEVPAGLLKAIVMPPPGVDPRPQAIQQRQAEALRRAGLNEVKDDEMVSVDPDQLPSWLDIAYERGTVGDFRRLLAQAMTAIDVQYDGEVDKLRREAALMKKRLEAYEPQEQQRRNLKSIAKIFRKSLPKPEPVVKPKPTLKLPTEIFSRYQLPNDTYYEVSSWQQFRMGMQEVGEGRILYQLWLEPRPFDEAEDRYETIMLYSVVYPAQNPAPRPPRLVYT